MSIEIFKPVIGYEKYYRISNRGRVKSFYRGKPKFVGSSLIHTGKTWGHCV